MIYSKLLSRQGLNHGFTTKKEKASQPDSLVLAQQIHGDKIRLVDVRQRGKRIKGVDGLITKTRGLKIGVRTADCVPLLFYEPVKKIAGAIHAGWRGTQSQISAKMIKKIKKMGGLPEKVFVVMGPHICSACYTVPPSRAKQFSHTVVWQKEGRFHLDLARGNFEQLVEAGVRKENIEVLPYCTACQSNLFFSFRKNKGKEDGEMLAVIGLR